MALKVRGFGLMLVWICLSAARPETQAVSLVHSELIRMTTERDGVAAAGPWAVPCEAARVTVPTGVTVTVSTDVPCRYEYVVIEHGATFHLQAGRFTVGTIVAHGTYRQTGGRLVFQSNGKPFDHATDPLELMRGLIAMAPVDIRGAPKREICELAGFPAAGATSLTLACDPTGWANGDELLIAPTLWGQDEVVRVTAITGRTITFAPALRFTRQNVPADPAIRVHVGHLTRAVVIESAVEDKGNRQLQGHVMLMGGGHRVSYAAIPDTGRTVARFWERTTSYAAPVTDPRLVINPDGTVTRDPQLFPLCGGTEENVRGRYALHFHNPSPSSVPSIVEGVVIRVQRQKGFKIGIQNHSAYVLARRNILHQIDGSGLFTEEGNERGEYVGNLVVHSFGSNSPKLVLPGNTACMSNNYKEIWDRRRDDFGHRGAGAWAQGGNVLWKDNIFAGHDHAGFDHTAEGLETRHPNTFEVRIRPDHLLNTTDEWYRLASKLPADYDRTAERMDVKLPVLRVEGHHIYAIGTDATKDQRYADKACIVAGHGRNFEQWVPRPKNLYLNTVCWNAASAVKQSYSDVGRLEHFIAIRGFLPPGSRQDRERLTLEGVNTREQNGRWHDYVHVRIEGWEPATAFKPSEGSIFTNVSINGQPYVPTSEACEDRIDNDGDGQIDEGCLTGTGPPPPPPPPPPDTTPPDVAIGDPVAVTLKYTITITAKDFDGSGIETTGPVTVEVLLDGVPLTQGEQVAPVTVPFDLTIATLGPHVIEAYGTDAAGNRTTEPVRKTVIR